MEITFIFGIVALVVVNCIATAWALRDDFSTNSQKIAQALVVWFVPIIGACLVFGTKRHTLEKERSHVTTLHDPDPFCSSPNLRDATAHASPLDSNADAGH